ncbi:hypothetical protein ACQEVF_17775 [Nonomuraea polychroma]|uniref:hypothetical protein n=1 Tax=Nonomuraea polychroma TaxID=46176 RepID=UPI003D931440
MKSDIAKIYDTHKRSWFPNPTHGRVDQCSGHGVVGPPRNCEGRVTNDVLLIEQSGTQVHWAVCSKWLEEEPKAVAYLRDHGYNQHDPD